MIRARGVRPRSVPTCSVPIATSAAPSTMPEELPAWWTWSICSTQWYFSSATSSKPASRRRCSAKRGLSPARPSTRGVGADELVVVEHGHAVEVLDRDDRRRRSSRWPRPWRRGGATRRRTRRRPARLQPSRVAIRSAPMPCGTKPVVERGGRVHRPGAAVGAHRHAAHRLDAAGEDQVLEAAADPRRGLVDGLEAGGAEAVELHAGDGLGVARPRARRSWRCRRPGRRSARRRRARRRRRGSGRASGLRALTSSSRPTTRSTGFTSCSEPSALPLPRGVRRWS